MSTPKTEKKPLSRDKIHALIKDKSIAIHLFDEIDSTSDEARRIALGGGHAPALIMASSQSAGRGRMGRSFHSPADTGLYLSYLQKAPHNAADTVRLTTATAVALSLAIEDVFGIRTEIKWVNDLLLFGKKVSGILAESFLADGDRFVIIGIGVNLATEDFPDDIKARATSLGVDADNREELAAAIINRLSAYCEYPQNPEIARIYKERSAVLQKKVWLYTKNERISAQAEDIKEDGTLVVRLSSGEIRELHSGEITLRFDDGKEI